MKKEKYLIFVLLLSLLILNSDFAVATETDTDNPLYTNNPEVQTLNEKIEANKDKIDNLKKAAQEYAQKIEDYKNQASTLKNQLSLLENQIIKVELDIKTNQLQIDKTRMEIEALQYQISQGEAEIEVQKSSLIEYLKLINKTDQKTYLEILILNDSLAEFFNQINYLESIQGDIQKSVERLKLLKTTIEVQKADTEREKQALESLKQELNNREAKLLSDNEAKVLLLSEAISSEDKFQRLLIEAKQRQNEIDSNILNLQEEVKAKITKLRKPNTTANNTLVQWPLKTPHTITSYFHDPDYPFRYVFEHPAIDIRASQGTKITAPADGYVARAKDAGYGYSYIILIHDNGLSTVYGHVSAIYVSEDTYVQTGEVIGLTGGLPGTRGAGNLSTGAHLHFEVRLNGLPVNPLEYLP